MTDARSENLLGNGTEVTLHPVAIGNLAHAFQAPHDSAWCEQPRPPIGPPAASAAHTVTRALIGRTVAAVERDLIMETLEHCSGNRTHAANILGICIRTLRNRLNEYASDGVPISPSRCSEK